MTSSVHYKFKSQKEPARVTFDGTGISVFELKREIITRDKLGDGSDFELTIYNQDTNEEYDDDTTIIPRSTYVVARRLPAARPGRGGAARYVSGSMPVRARNNVKAGASSKAASTAAKTQGLKANMSSAQTEEERMQAMFNLEADQWKQQKEEMANATPVFTGRPMKGKPMNVPEGEPPHGYICYRCGKKGHWIQACPTNDDPEYDGRLRVKRTTGIPRSFLKTVAKPDNIDASSEEARRLMVNADGDFVIAETDQKAWKQYQEKAKASAAAQEAAAAGSKELQDLGIECTIDMKMFVDPMKTPCCGKTYCNDCITNALIESDLVCPGCSTENVLIDDLKPDHEAQDNITAYKTRKQEKAASKTPEPESINGAKCSAAGEQAKSPAGKTSRSNSPASANGGTSTPSKKRPVEDDKFDEQGKAGEEAPAMKKQKSQETNNATKAPTPSLDAIFSQNSTPFNPMAQTAFPPMPGFPQGMPFMGMQPNMAMMNRMMNPAMMSNFNGMMNGMPNMPMPNMMNNMSFPTQMNGMVPPSMNGMPQPSNQNNYHQQQQQQQSHQPPRNNNNAIPGAPTGPAAMRQQQQGNNNNSNTNRFSNQQRNAMVGQGEENAYFRQPVNPHRHQARQRRVRPSDYREL